MVFELFSWWYGPGWVQAIKRIYTWARSIEQTLSAGMLLGSLFEPWKRIISAGGRGLDVKIKNAIDNLVSRLVGASVRLLVLVTAGLLIILAVIFGICLAVIWPLMPPAIIFCFARGAF